MRLLCRDILQILANITQEIAEGRITHAALRYTQNLMYRKGNQKTTYFFQSHFQIEHKLQPRISHYSQHQEAFMCIQNRIATWHKTLNRWIQMQKLAIVLNF